MCCRACGGKEKYFMYIIMGKSREETASRDSEVGLAPINGLS